MEIELKYRCWPPALAPRPIKLQIPGWAGDSHGHKDGDQPQPWHCIPFVEANTYGLELLWQFDFEARLSRRNGETVIEGPEGIFKQFAPAHVGFQGGLDILVPDGHVLRLEPHPRYFTDETGTVPLMVPGHLQTQWWARYFFIVFKVPPEGQTHIFRPGEPYGQILVVPKKVIYKVREMDEQEKIRREKMQDDSLRYDSLIGKNNWTAANGVTFNDKYRILASAYAKEGMAGVDKVYARAYKKAQELLQPQVRSKVPRKLLNKKERSNELAQQHLPVD